MPVVLYLLALAVFAMGTSEFMLSGLLPGIAHDLAVPLPAAGALTSAFAVGMVVGAPAMALLGMRWPRRRALLGFLVTFALAHAVGALTGDFAVLLVTRVVAAVANAGFLAVAIATGAALAGPAATGRATAVLLGGTTLACVAGVPAGAALGELWGWRSAFWAVAAAALPAVLGVARSVPDETPHATAPAARAELGALRDPLVRRLLLLGALVNGATFGAFTYLAPLFTGPAGFPEGWVPALLALFGLGASAGVAAAGRFGDRAPGRVLVRCGVPLPLGWAALALGAGSKAAVALLVPVVAALSFAVGATLIAGILRAAHRAPALGGGFATAALNVGAAAGPALGGLALGSGLGARAVLAVAALLTAAAWPVALAGRLLPRALRAPGRPAPSDGSPEGDRRAEGTAS